MIDAVKAYEKVPYLEGVKAEKELRYADALVLFEKGDALGSGKAQYRLAVMYFRGRGVIIDYKRSKDFFKKALKNGDPRAHEALALFDMIVNTEDM